MIKVSAKELLSWIDDAYSIGGDKNSLYLLLDLIGGISREELYSVRIDSSKDIYLKENLNKINSYWLEFNNESKPIQYICGQSYWRDFKFKVSRDVLIPRKETEQIVDIALDICGDKNKILFADLGTGSGVIAIALAAYKEFWSGLATDINIKALNIAKENFESICKYPNLKFYFGNWWEPLADYAGKIEIAISNPPYIPYKVYEKLSHTVKNYEPEIALNGGMDGLKHIDQITKFAPRFLKKGGWLILENHFDQSNAVMHLLNKNGFDSIKIINDYSGIGRFAIARYK